MDERTIPSTGPSPGRKTPILWVGFTSYAVGALFIQQRFSQPVILILLLAHLTVLPAIALYWYCNRARAGRSPGARPWQPYPVLILFLAAAVPLALWWRAGFAHNNENAYDFQARVFLTGRLAADAPPVQTPNFSHNIIYRQRWFIKHPPGWPVILALAKMLRLGWIVNPLFGLGILWLSWSVARRLFSGQTGVLAIAMLAASPFFFFNCMGLMPHASCGFITLAGFTAYLEGVRTRRLPPFLFLFIVIGLVVLIRPLTGVCLGGIFGLAILYEFRKERSLMVKILAGGFLIGAAAIALYLSYNWAQTGSFRRSPYALYRGAETTVEINLHPGSLIRNLLTLTRWSIQETMAFSFPFVFIFAALAVVLERTRRTVVILLAGIFLSLVCGYMIQTESSGSPVGERYYFEGFFAVAILAGRGWSLLAERWRLDLIAQRAALLVLLMVQALAFFMFSDLVLREIRPFRRLCAAIAESAGDYDLIFMRRTPDFHADYYNPNEGDWKKAPTLFLVDPGPDNRQKAVSALSRRRVGLLTYSPQTGRATLERIKN